MKTYIVLVLFIWAATRAVCAQNESVSEHLTERLVDRWSHDGPKGTKCFAHYEKEYFSNGLAEGFVDLYQLNGDGSHGKYFQHITFTSKWRVDGDIVIIWDIKSNPAGYLDTNKSDHDTVLFIDSKRLRYKSNDGTISEHMKCEELPNHTAEPGSPSRAGSP